MRNIARIPWIVGVTLAAVSILVPVARTECTGEQQAALEADLLLRLKPYMELREQAKSQLPPLKETADQAKLQGRQQALANSVRAARRDARQGDILGGPIADCLIPVVKRNLAPSSAKQTTKEGNPAHEGPSTKVAVNAPYLSEAPLSTMPPRLLLELPQLPKGLEYRFIGRTLILFDADACLIVDFLPNAGS